MESNVNFYMLIAYNKFKDSCEELERIKLDSIKDYDYMLDLYITNNKFNPFDELKIVKEKIDARYYNSVIQKFIEDNIHNYFFDIYTDFETMLDEEIKLETLKVKDLLIGYFIDKFFEMQKGKRITNV